MTHTIFLSDNAAERLERLAALHDVTTKQAAEELIKNKYQEAAGTDPAGTLFEAVLKKTFKDFEYLTAGESTTALYINLAADTDDPDAEAALMKLIRAAQYTIEHEPQGAKLAEYEHDKILNAIKDEADAAKKRAEAWHIGQLTARDIVNQADTTESA